MKKFNYFYTLILCVFSVCCFTACGSDEDPSNPTSKGLSISLNKSSLEFESGASGTYQTLPIPPSPQKITVTVTGCTDCRWDIDDPDMCYIEESPYIFSEPGTYELTVACRNNERYEDRKALITFFAIDKKGNEKTATCSVSQKARNTIIITENHFEFDQPGGYFDVEIESNVQYSYTIEDDAKSWIHNTTASGSRALTKNSLHFMVDENGASGRVGHITIKGENIKDTITITQEGLKGSITEAEVTVTVSTPGTLSSLIGENRRQTITSIKIIGSLNYDDMSVVRQMSNLSYLDLGDVSMPDNEFHESGTWSTSYGVHRPLETLILPKKLKKWICYRGSSEGNIKYLYVPKSLVETEWVSSFVTVDNLFIDDVAKYITNPIDIPLTENGKVFCNNKLVKNITIPYGATVIYSALKGYKYLESIDIPETVTRVYYDAFKGSSIKEMKINSFEHWTKVFNRDNTPFSENNHGRLIYNGKQVESVVISSSISDIDGAFAYVEGIKEVHCKSSTPAKLNVYYDFNLIDKKRVTLYVPKGSKSTYYLSDWGDIFENIVEE